MNNITPEEVRTARITLAVHELVDRCWIPDDITVELPPRRALWELLWTACHHQVCGEVSTDHVRAFFDPLGGVKDDAFVEVVMMILDRCGISTDWCPCCVDGHAAG